MDLDSLRTCALLHDIGKPACWALGALWSEHVMYTHSIVSGALGDSFGWTAMRHHTGQGYPEKYHPRNIEERIIWLADKLSSGIDRRGRSEAGSGRPHPPIVLAHPLSKGEVPISELNADQLKSISQRVVEDLRKSAHRFSEDKKSGYLRIYKTVENSNLDSIPADTRSPINDVSLWHHSKLTVAFATCILLDGGWKGEETSNYEFTLLSGDGDKISSYILESVRIPDLNARSEKVKRATKEAAARVEEIVGPECVIFAGGGSLLSLCPNSLVEEVKEEVSEAFETAMEGAASFTVSYVRDSGDKFQSRFGEVWGKAVKGLRIEKLKKPLKISDPINPEAGLCDVCHTRPAAYQDLEKMLPIDASPRPEALCERCWRLREEGKGVWIEDLSKKTNYIAIVKADGDNMGRIFDGSIFKKFEKGVSPSRLSVVSNLLNKVCEDRLTKIIGKFDGKIIFAGGDDLLALVPGEWAFNAAAELADKFGESMNFECTISAGVAVLHSRLPIYAGLEKAYELIKVAKGRPGKNGVAFAIGSIERRLDAAEAGRGWDELNRILNIVDFFKKSGIPTSQVRRIAVASRKDPDLARIYVKYLIGRKVIDWDIGIKFLENLESGLLRDAFNIHNMLREE
ncbi:MAG: type III-B CRISPR-associated protein Cas10/Cmr2 [Candidatus Bathyarchaeia archaeon]